MKTKTLPVEWEYSLAMPSFTYWDTFGLLEQEWAWKERYRTEPPGSKQFAEYLFWRKVSVIWVCATIEGFINEEGAAWAGPDWFKQNVERSRVEEKINILYALKYRQLLPDDLPQLKDLKKLFDLRNQLVHPKPSKHKPGEKFNPPAVDITKMQFKELRKIFHGVTSLFEPTGFGDQRDPETPPDTSQSSEEL
jgi:hypothetical protein